MSENLKKEGKFSYLEIGEGTPIIILHGLMGGLSNFDGVADFFPPKGYKILIPELPIYKMTLLRTNVKNFAKYVAQFIDHLGYKEVILLGNSLGGHIGLLCTKMYPEVLASMKVLWAKAIQNAAIMNISAKKQKMCFMTLPLQPKKLLMMFMKL